MLVLTAFYTIILAGWTCQNVSGRSTDGNKGTDYDFGGFGTAMPFVAVRPSPSRRYDCPITICAVRPPKTAALPRTELPRLRWWGQRQSMEAVPAHETPS